MAITSCDAEQFAQITQLELEFIRVTHGLTLIVQ
jgi:hypothetical protein